MGLKRHISRDPLTPLLYQGLLCGLYPQIPLFPIPPASWTGPRVQFSYDLGIPRGQGEQQSIPSRRPVQPAPCPEARVALSPEALPGSPHPYPSVLGRPPSAPWTVHTHLMTVGVISAQKNTLRLPTAWEANMPTMEKVMENLSLTLSLIPGGEPGR